MSSEGEEEEDTVVYSTPKPSLFALLSDEELEEWESEASDSEDERNAGEPFGPLPAEEPAACSSSDSSSSTGDIDELFDEHMRLIGESERLWHFVDLSALEEGREFRQRLGDVRGVLRKPENRLIAPRTAWPKVPAARLGFKVVRAADMDADCTDPGEYRVQVSDEYLERFDYLQLLVNAADAGALYQFVQEHPESVEALLVMSDILRSSNVADAANTVELAIYQIEKALPGRFRWTEAVLPYAEPNNRTVHLALFRHLQYMLRRGSWRAAAEVGKLLYGLDRSDPLCSVLLIDYAAIQLRDASLNDAMMADLGDDPRYPFLAYSRALIHRDAKALSEAVAKCPQGAQVFHKLEPAKEAYAHVCFKLYFARTASLWKALPIPDAIPESRNGEAELEVDAQLPVYRHAYLADLPGVNLRIAYPSQTTTSLDPFPPTTDGIDYDGIARNRGASLLNILSDFLSRQ